MTAPCVPKLVASASDLPPFGLKGARVAPQTNTLFWRRAAASDAMPRLTGAPQFDLPDPLAAPASKLWARASRSRLPPPTFQEFIPGPSASSPFVCTNSLSNWRVSVRPHLLHGPTALHASIFACQSPVPPAILGG